MTIAQHDNVFQREPSDDGTGNTTAKSGTWVLRHDERGAPRAILGCPRCQKTIAVDYARVAVHGSVTHAVTCPCGWFDYVHLGGWDAVG